MKTAYLERFVKMELSDKIRALIAESPKEDLEEKIDEILEGYEIKEKEK